MGVEDVTEGVPEKTFRMLPVRSGRWAGLPAPISSWTRRSGVPCPLPIHRYWADGGLEVRDLESTNGTFVNGEDRCGPG